jgi:lauroyl/myristoyl acyltransferase
MLRGARAAGVIDDEEKWRSSLRLTRIFSYADLYLSMFRSDRWLRKHVDVTGSWPQGAFLAVTYHWGAGMWALRHLRAHGKRTAFLSIRFDRATFQNSRLRYWYGLLRTRETSRAGGDAGVIFTGGSSARIASAHRDGACVMALLDVPPKPDQASAPVTLLGRPARLRRGLARLAMEENIPVVTFRMNLDRDSGRLKLLIDNPLHATTEEALMEQLAASFGSALDADPCAWHSWSEVELYLEPAVA